MALPALCRSGPRPQCPWERELPRATVHQRAKWEACHRAPPLAARQAPVRLFSYPTPIFSALYKLSCFTVAHSPFHFHFVRHASGHRHAPRDDLSRREQPTRTGPAYHPAGHGRAEDRSAGPRQNDPGPILLFGPNAGQDPGPAGRFAPSFFFRANMILLRIML